MAAVHEMMEGLRQGSAIDEQAMRDFDVACLALASEPDPGEQQRGSGQAA